jgi:hypoxanthine phosphoribosyltransferase
VRFLEYSLESYRDESLKLARTVEADGYSPDCVAYLARGGWQIGQACAEHFGASLVELSAHRSGDAAKEGAHSLLASLPGWAKHAVRRAEVAYRLSRKDNSEQEKSCHITGRFHVPASARRVLLVDDSADTGTSVRAAVRLLRETFPGADVRVAVINSFAPARKSGLLDWSLHEDCLPSTPMSKDNRDYERASAAYERFGQTDMEAPSR